MHAGTVNVLAISLTLSNPNICNKSEVVLKRIIFEIGILSDICLPYAIV